LLPTAPIAAETSPRRPPGTAAAMPAARASSAVAIRAWSSSRPPPTVSEIAESPTHPSRPAPASGRDAVQRDVVDRGAEDTGVGRHARVRLVVEERRAGTGLVQHGAGDLVELAQPDAGRRGGSGGRQHAGDHLARGPHRVDL